MVGVAFQALTRAQSSGFIIPVPVVQRFLSDCEDGTYQGVPAWGIETQDFVLNNPASARFYRLPKSMTPHGVIVSRVHEWSPANGIISRGDVILAISGKDIGVDGKIELEGERVDFEVVYDLRLIGDKIRLQVLREGEIRELIVEANAGKAHPYSGRIYSKRPRYTVFGGIVFTALSRSLMDLWGEIWERKAPLLLRYVLQFPHEAWIGQGRDEIVLVSDVLVNKANASLEASYPIVDKINGKRILSLEMLHELTSSLKDETLRIDFLFDDDPWILNSRELKDSNEETYRRYGVTPSMWLAPYSVDGAISKEESL